MPRLAYHTFYGSFSGDTPDEIIQQLYEDTRKAYPEMTKQGWWDYQRRLWKLLEDKALPATLDDPDAAEAFIACAVEAGALDEGSKPR